MKMDRIGKGFTLVELLVVISIIALLLSVLVPVLSKAREQTRRVICGSNLRQYGVAIQFAASDAKGVIMSTPTFADNDTMPFPDHWFAKTPTGPKSDNLNCETINRYMDAFRWGPPGWNDTSNQPDVRDHIYATNISMCPSVNMKFFNGLVNGYYQSWGHQSSNLGQGHIQFCYAYYGRVDRWRTGAYNNAKNELVGNVMNARRIIMADTIRFGPQGGRDWAYNHGKRGWATQFTNIAPGTYADTGEPDLTGINQMYGDGHVEWKSATTMNTSQMGTKRYKGGYVDTYGTLKPGDVAWYYASPSAFDKETRTRFD